MTVRAQQVWLTNEAHERLQQELSELLAQGSGRDEEGAGTAEDRDRATFDDHSFLERQDREQRIRNLQETLQHAVVGEEPPDDGIAEPGMVVTIRYADEPDTETFLLAEPQEQEVHGDIEVCSPGSPLGMAVSGAKKGEQRQYKLPGGNLMTVSVVRAVPFGRH